MSSVIQSLQFPFRKVVVFHDNSFKYSPKSLGDFASFEMQLSTMAEIQLIKKK